MVRRQAGKQRDFGSIPVRVSCLQKLWSVDSLATLYLKINEFIKMALIAAHLNAGIILVVTA